MTEKLSDMDKKVIQLLDSNNRLSLSQFARKGGIPRQVLEYRINKLVEQGVIKKFLTVIDITKFYNHIWHVHLKINKLTKTVEKKLFDYLFNVFKAWSVSRTYGEWDLYFQIIGNDLNETNNKMMEFHSNFDNVIIEQQITPFINGYWFPRGYLVGKTKKRQSYYSEWKQVDLQENEIKILRQLRQNWRLTATQIAQHTGLTARQVVYQIKNLTSKKVITGYRLYLDLEKTDCNLYIAYVYTNTFSNSVEQSVLSWCENNKYAVRYARMIAPWTFEIHFECPAYEVLHQTLNDLRGKLGGIIKTVKTDMVTQRLSNKIVLPGIEKP